MAQNNATAIRHKLYLVWFRNDLRIHDHEPLHRAIQHANKHNAYILPVFFFDTRLFQLLTFPMKKQNKTNENIRFRKTGARRAQFLIESVQDLRNNFQQLNGNLMVRVGQTEQEMQQLINELSRYFHIEGLFASKE